MIQAVLMVGGRGERMGRGVKSLDATKGLLQVPFNGVHETVIDRTLRLLSDIGAISNPADVLMCVGYKAALVKEMYPKCQFLTTYDPDDPCDTVPAFQAVIDAFPKVKALNFFLGDVVWSKTAIADFWAKRGCDALVMYHGKDPHYCETYAMAVNGKAGKAIIARANSVESMPVVYGEVRWRGHQVVPMRQCRTTVMEQWIDINDIPGKTRLYPAGDVDDIDWDVDHANICAAIERGGFQ